MKQIYQNMETCRLAVKVTSLDFMVGEIDECLVLSDTATGIGGPVSSLCTLKNPWQVEIYKSKLPGQNSKLFIPTMNLTSCLKPFLIYLEPLPELRSSCTVLRSSCVIGKEIRALMDNIRAQ